jgi:ADP-ribosylglycohydrolase
VSGELQSSKPTLADRLRGALWGQFVGDAACLGSHWVYDLADLAKRFPAGIQGFEEPAPGHYHYGKKPGDQTHYGDAALVLLAAVAETGSFSAPAFGARFIDLMGSDDYRGYRDHATKETLARYRAFLKAQPGSPFDYQQGADDDQPATVTRLVPVVVAHWRNSDLLETVATATRVSQDNLRAIAYAQTQALVLLHLFAGLELDEACRSAEESIATTVAAGNEVAAKIAAARAATAEGVTEATLRFGQTCPLAGSFPAALHATLVHRDDFAAAILATARAGGDNAARAAMIGGWLGARLGLQGIPAHWRERLTARDAIEQDVERLVTRVTSG